MVTAIVLVNVARTQVNAVAKTLAEMAGISEAYSVTGELDLAAIVSGDQRGPGACPGPSLAHGACSH